MTIAHFTAPQMVDTYSNFISWAGPIQQALWDLGFTQTNDTGQTDFVALNFNITGTQLTGNVATFTCDNTNNIRVGQSLVISGLTSDGAIYNGTRTVTSFTATTFTAAITNADIAYAGNAGTAVSVVTSSAPATSTIYYQVWRFTDTLQASMPVYLKLVFGALNVTNYTSNALGPNFYIIAGTGSNGSGTITGAATMGSSAQSFPTTTSYAMTYSSLADCYVSGDSGRLGIFLWRTSPWPKFFAIERTRNSSGDYTADGVQLVWCYAYQTTTSVITTYKGFDFFDVAGVHLTSGHLPCINFAGSATLYKAAITVFPLFSPYGGLHYPMTACMSGKYADFTELDEFEYTLYDGNVMNFIVFSLSNTSGTPRAFGNSSTNAILMRYD